MNEPDDSSRYTAIYVSRIEQEYRRSTLNSVTVEATWEMGNKSEVTGGRNVVDAYTIVAEYDVSDGTAILYGFRPDCERDSRLFESTNLRSLRALCFTAEVVKDHVPDAETVEDPRESLLGELE